MVQQQAEQLFKDVGPAGDLFAVDAYPAEAMWHIAVSETSTLFAELDSARGVIVLSSDLGAPAGDRTSLYATLLHYNHAWTATGGARVSVDAEGGSLCLIADCAVDTLDADGLARWIHSFAGVADAWRQIVRGEKPAPSGVGSLDFGAIRI